MNKIASNSPALSVVLPVYNGEKYVAETIESVLNQTFTDFEFIIIDDGSTDNTAKITDAFAKKDKRIVAVRQQNIGLVDTLNKGLNLAKAKYIARIDADDICLKQRFELQYNYMQQRPNLAVLGGCINIMDESGKFIRKGIYPLKGQEMAKFIVDGSPLAHPAVMLNKELVLKTGGYRKAFTHCEDYDLWLRLFDEGYQIENLPDVIINYRQNLSGISSKFREQQAFATVITKVAHRMRKSGLSDPFDNGIPVSDASLGLIPEVYLKEISNELIEIKLTKIQLFQNEEFLQKINEVPQLIAHLNNEQKCRIYLRIVNYLLSRKMPFYFLTFISKAFLSNPKYFTRMFLSRCYLILRVFASGFLRKLKRA